MTLVVLLDFFPTLTSCLSSKNPWLALEILDIMRCATLISRQKYVRFCHRKREDAIVIYYAYVYI